MTFPTGPSDAQCGACRRGFNSRRCLEPSSIGLWLATDGLWSIEPRSAKAELDRIIQMTRDRQMARKAPPDVPLSDEQAAPVPLGTPGPQRPSAALRAPRAPNRLMPPKPRPLTDRPAGFTPPTGPGRCPRCGWHTPTQGHHPDCPARRPR